MKRIVAVVTLCCVMLSGCGTSSKAFTQSSIKAYRSEVAKLREQDMHIMPRIHKGRIILK